MALALSGLLTACSQAGTSEDPQEVQIVVAFSGDNNGEISPSG